jgi:hypothetical protein
VNRELELLSGIFTYALKLGANAYQIAAILGHGDIKTSQIYSQATDETLRRLMENLAKVEAVPAKVPPAEEGRPLLTAVNY